MRNFSRKPKKIFQKRREELEEVSYELSEIRQKYSKTLTDKIIEGLKDLNFLDVQFQIDFQRKKNIQQVDLTTLNTRFRQTRGESETAGQDRIRR